MDSTSELQKSKPSEIQFVPLDACLKAPIYTYVTSSQPKLDPETYNISAPPTVLQPIESNVTQNKPLPLLSPTAFSTYKSQPTPVQPVQPFRESSASKDMYYFSPNVSSGRKIKGLQPNFLSLDLTTLPKYNKAVDLSSPRSEVGSFTKKDSKPQYIDRPETENSGEDSRILSARKQTDAYINSLMQKYSTSNMKSSQDNMSNYNPLTQSDTFGGLETGYSRTFPAIKVTTPDNATLPTNFRSFFHNMGQSRDYYSPGEFTNSVQRDTGLASSQAELRVTPKNFEFKGVNEREVKERYSTESNDGSDRDHLLSEIPSDKDNRVLEKSQTFLRDQGLLREYRQEKEKQANVLQKIERMYSPASKGLGSASKENRTQAQKSSGGKRRDKENYQDQKPIQKKYTENLKENENSVRSQAYVQVNYQTCSYSDNISTKALEDITQRQLSNNYQGLLQEKGGDNKVANIRTEGRDLYEKKNIDVKEKITPITQTVDNRDLSTFKEENRPEFPVKQQPRYQELESTGYTKADSVKDVRISEPAVPKKQRTLEQVSVNKALEEKRETEKVTKENIKPNVELEKKSSGGYIAYGAVVCLIVMILSWLYVILTVEDFDDL